MVISPLLNGMILQVPAEPSDHPFPHGFPDHVPTPHVGPNAAGWAADPGGHGSDRQHRRKIPHGTENFIWNHLCWDLNSHCFPMVGMVINLVVGVCIPILRIQNQLSKWNQLSNVQNPYDIPWNPENPGKKSSHQGITIVQEDQNCFQNHWNLRGTNTPTPHCPQQIRPY